MRAVGGEAERDEGDVAGAVGGLGRGDGRVGWFLGVGFVVVATVVGGLGGFVAAAG